MSSNQPPFVNFDALAVGRSSSDPFVTYFSTRNPTTNDVNFPIQKRWFNTDEDKEWILVSYTSSNETLTANWREISAGMGEVQFLKGNSGGPVGPDASHIINVLGDVTYIDIVGTPGTNTLTVSATNALKNYISLTPYIVGTDVHSGFATIQAAITQAVADGASAATPKNIYIKPGTYTENLTVHDGINLIGMNTETAGNPAGNVCSVVLNGTVTHASGNVYFTGINFALTTGNTYNMHGGFLTILGCYTSHSSGSFYVLTTAAAKNIVSQSSMYNCSNTASLFSTDGSGMAVSIYHEHDYVLYLQASSVVTGTTDFSIGHAHSNIVNGFNIDSLHFSATWTHSQADQITNVPFVTSGNSVVNGNFQIQTSNIGLRNNGVLFDFSLGADIQYTLVNSEIGTSGTGLWSYIENPTSNKHRTNFFVKDQNAQNGQLVFHTQIQGWSGTEHIRGQGMLQTGDGALHTIATIAVPLGGTTTVQVMVSGQEAAAADATGGNIVVTARNPAGVAILAAAPVTNVMATSTGTFTANVNAGNIIIQVQGIAATTYNWVVNYEYGSVILNT